MTAEISNPKENSASKLLAQGQLVILCGGKGTRLREETEWKPKPMVQLGEWPILWHIMRYYACFGVKRFVLCLGYKGQVIKDFFVNYHQTCADIRIKLGKNDITYAGDGYVGDDWEIVLANTGIDTNTAGRVAAIEKYIEGDSFMLTYGDGLSDVDLSALVECHVNGKRVGTVTAVRPASRFGELMIIDDKVDTFSEKPNVSKGWINGGFFVFERGIFKFMPDMAVDVSFEYETLRDLAEHDELSVYQHEGFWQCVDTYRELVSMEKLWSTNQAPWKRW